MRRPLRSVGDPVQAKAARPQPQFSDEELISGVRAGRDWAGNALYSQLFPSVDRTLSRVLGSRDHEYDDLVQVVFEQLMLTIIEGRFAGDCKLSTWACSIASNIGIDALRARTRRRKLFEPVPELRLATTVADSGTGQERRLEARSTYAQVQRALADIDPGKAQVIVLHHVLGYELALVASLMGLSAAACQSRLVRGRKEFTEKMASLSGGNDDE